MHWRYVGAGLGAVAGLVAIALLTFPEQGGLVAKGPLNTGHETLACQDCHTPVEGSTAQQLSANVHHWLGLRETTIGFGSIDVGNAACLDCHERPEDRHPVSRFLEPRFAEQRMHLKAHLCVTCHTEHQGVRVTQETLGFCTQCHQDTALEDDPIFPSHAELVETEAWNTCLQCHDFHGNHVRTTPVRLDDGVSEAQLWAYFTGGPSPYGDVKIAEASETRGGDAR